MAIKKTKVTPEIPAASLSDIIFLLLIFFLVTTTLAVEKGLPMSLPGKQSKTVKLKQDAVFHVQIQANGQIVTKDTGPIPIERVKELIENKLGLNEKLVIVIETHPDADYGIMIDVLDELRLAKATRISLRMMTPGA
ncbi:MAG: biopolymer transporter ExbD [Candidatus Latescibacterota bacterium]|jgi:biopolymer transport protein ExbD|nr:MAG: biopolymer transporter ExbD [Candidatus Latescibacterota bacterium]